VIGLDANVLVRYATQDDPGQVRVVEELFDSLTIESPGFVSTVVLVESIWVLRQVFGVDAESVARFVSHLLGSAELVIEHPEAVRGALDSTAGSADFNDALIARVAVAVGCDHTVTLDKRAAKFPGMRLLVAKN
jgi:predicted nucleic-acid-binding protein